MKILFVDFTLPYLINDSDYPAGGWSTQLLAWIDGLTSAQHKVGVLTFDGASKLIDRPVPFDILESYTPQQGIRFARYFSYFIPSMSKVIKEYNPDYIIQACSGVQTAAIAYIAKKLNIKFIHRIANNRDVDNRIYEVLKWHEVSIYRYGVKCSDGILCQNKYQNQSIKKTYPAKKSTVIHNPFLPTSTLKDKINKGKYVAWIGRFTRQKNLPLLLQIAQSLPCTEFRIAGGTNNKLDDDLQETVESLGKLDNVKMMGYLKRSAVPDFLSSAECLLSTSFYEGFSNVILEALFAGTPVVLPDRIDPDDIIRKNNLGFSVKSDDLLSHSIRKLFSLSSAAYTEMTKNCRAYVIDNHNPVTKGKELIKFLQEL